MEKHLEDLQKELDSKNPQSSIVRQQDFLKVVRRNGDTVDELELDLAKSGAPIRHFRDERIPGGKAVVKVTWRWEQIDGVWAPAEVRRTESRTDFEGTREYSTTLTWTENRVNVPIPCCLFERTQAAIRADMRNSEQEGFEADRL